MFFYQILFRWVVVMQKDLFIWLNMFKAQRAEAPSRKFDSEKVGNQSHIEPKTSIYSTTCVTEVEITEVAIVSFHRVHCHKPSFYIRNSSFVKPQHSWTRERSDAQNAKSQANTTFLGKASHPKKSWCKRRRTKFLESWFCVVLVYVLFLFIPVVLPFFSGLAKTEQKTAITKETTVTLHFLTPVSFRPLFSIWSLNFS